MKYYNVKDSDKFLLEGSIALSEEFNRFYLSDIKLLENINDKVAYLSKCSSGIILKFETNSSKINIKARIKNRFFMSHLSGIAESGFDLYLYSKLTGEYEFYNTTNFELLKSDYDIKVYDTNDYSKKKFLLYFPLYAKVENIEIGLDDNALINKGIPYNDKILIYGTSIAQGASASRPGLSFTNIISRKLGVEIYNYGFSGQAFLEKELATVISRDKDHSILIIDAEPNAGIDERLINNLETFYLEYRRNHPMTKIIIISRITYGRDLFDESLVLRKERHKTFLREFSKKHKYTYFLDGSLIFKGNINDKTVDGIHPNDLGMLDIANAYISKIKEIKALE